MAMLSTPFPATLEMDYPNRQLDRLTSFLRPLTVIPIAAILTLIVGAGVHTGAANAVTGSGGVLFVATVAMLVFRRKYIPYPDAPRDLNRWLPLVKWFLAIPHYVVLWFLGIAAMVSVVIAWFAILFTGHYPRALFDFVVGVLRWSLRVAAYAFLLTTDRYPPFSLSA